MLTGSYRQEAVTRKVWSSCSERDVSAGGTARLLARVSLASIGFALDFAGEDVERPGRFVGAARQVNWRAGVAEPELSELRKGDRV